MDELWIDGERLCTASQVHDLLASALSFPAWYGRNPDALFDCLQELRRPVRVHIAHEELLNEHMGEKWRQLRAALEAAAEESARVGIVTD